MHSQQGSMAEWLGTGLQNRLLQFESGWDLKRMLRHPFLIPLIATPCQVYKIYIGTRLCQAAQAHQGHHRQTAPTIARLALQTDRSMEQSISARNSCSEFAGKFKTIPTYDHHEPFPG